MRRPDDFHLHVRQEEQLSRVIESSTSVFARGLVMPNTRPPVVDEEGVNRYRDAILEETSDMLGTDFEPLMTVKLIGTTKPEQMPGLKRAGVIAGKVYPEGVTTNSEDGVSDIKTLYPVFEAMQDCGLVLCLHGEVPGVFCMNREEMFLSTLEDIALTFRRLRIVLEHVTTQAAVEQVKRLPENVVATITVHHLYLTLDDVVGDKIMPHHFCKPIAKTYADRRALLAAAISGNPKFFLGTDSAPWDVAAKECSAGCAGIFSAPVAIPALVQKFKQMDSLDKLEDFCSTFGARHYGLLQNTGTITLVEDPWVVPALVNGIVPFLTGQTLPYRVA